MIKKKQKPHSSTRKKTSVPTARPAKKVVPKAAKSAQTSKPPKKKAEELAREKEFKKLEQLTLKIFRWAYESNQRGEFQRL